MQELEVKLRDLFEFADQLPHPQNQSVRRNVKTIAAESGLTSLAVEFAGVISQGPAGKNARQPGAPRFNTTPPAAGVFFDPNSSAALGHAAVAAIDAEIDAADLAAEEGENPDTGSVEEVYAKISKMSPNVIGTTYGEGSIMGMIEKLGGDAAKAEGYKLNQKAGYLKDLIQNRNTDAK